MKLWKKALSITLAASMCVNANPVWGEQHTKAANLEEKKQEGKLVTKGKKDISKQKEKNYKEGEAIVLYQNTTSNMKAFSSKKVFGSDVSIKRTCDFSSFDTIEKKKGVVTKNSITKQTNNFTISLVKSDTLSTKELLIKLSKDKKVLKAEPNYIMHITGEADYSQYLWGLHNQEQNGGKSGEDLKVAALKDKEAAKDEKVIAVLDTGINYNHKDLKDHLWTNPYQEVIKGEHGYNFVSMDDDPLDDNGHGSHCAGIIAAGAEDGTGIKGIAADYNTKIMALKWIDSEGQGEIFNVISAYNYIYQMQQLGVDILAINNSWGGYVDSIYGEAAILEDVMELVGKNGAISVCAAGNETKNIDEEVAIPAAYDSNYIVSVGAATESGELAGFSCYGKKNVDLLAPGTNILSVVAGDTFNPTIYSKEEKEKLCNYYVNFQNDYIENPIEEIETVATGSAFRYSVYSDGEGAATVEKDKGKYFGLKEEDSASMKWSVKGAKTGDVYYLAIPYYYDQSKSPLYQSFMLQENAPELGEYDFSASTMEVYDIPVTSGSAFDLEEEIEKADTTLKNYCGGVYVYGKENYWNHMYYPTEVKNKKAGKRMNIFKLTIVKDGDYELNFDDYAISKEDAKEKEFGQYDFYNGTSMATPYVTGTVAIMRSLYPKEDVLKTRMRIVGSTTAKESLKDKLVTEGVLDLSKVSAPNPVISGASINDKGIVEVQGAFFGDNPTLRVNGITLTPLSVEDGKLTFQAEKNTKLDVEICRGQEKSEKSFLFISGKEIEKKGVMENNILGNADVISDGDKLYVVGDAGEISVYDVNNDTLYTAAELSGYEKGKLPMLVPNFLDGSYDAEELFEEDVKNLVTYETYKMASSATHGKEIYSAICLNLGYIEKNIIVKYDYEDGKWKKVADVPKEFKGVQGATLASYAGKLYLLGGYHIEGQKATSTVYALDTEKKTWTKMADMPEGRFLAKAVQTNKKLVVTLGGNGTEAGSKTLIFDGTSWTEGAKMEGVMDVSEAMVSIKYEEGMENGDGLTVIPLFEFAFRTLPYYDAVVGATDEGMIYSGIRMEKMGNTFAYDLNKNQFASSGKMLTTYSENDFVCGGTVGKKLIVLSGSESMTFDDYEDYSLSKKLSKNLSTKNVQQEGSDYGFEDNMENLVYISSQSVSRNNMIRVSQVKEYNEGRVQGIGRYEIGDLVKLTAIPYEGYFVKNIYVNGKKVKNGYTVKATEKLDGMKVKVDFGKYVTLVDLPNPSITIEEGASKKLNAAAYPSDAENKKLEYSSSDTSVATVDQSGKVTAKKGAAGETVVIKITAKDRKKISSYCTVYVVEKKTPKKVAVKKVQITASKKTVKVGKTLKLTAKVTPTNATNKKVTWKTSSKKFAVVSSKGVVKAKKAGKGKTVTITATSVSNPKVKGTIKIKIKK